MNLYIYGKLNKESMYQMLKNINSPFAELYKKAFPGKNDILKILEEFLNSEIMKKYKKIDGFKLLEAQALIKWIYRSLNSTDARIEATNELMSMLIRKHNLEGQIRISKGIVYLHSKVELSFISSIEEFYNYIGEMSSIGRTIFYRGHSEANHILIPSLMRKQNWLQNERKMYNELIIKCPGNFEKMKTHLEYLVEIQHYGLPTRLLDITQNALVALYFACENHLDSYGEIIVFSAEDRSIKYPQSDTVSILASLPRFEHEKQLDIYEYAIDEKLIQSDFNKKVQRLLHEVKTEKPAFKDQIIKEDLLHSLIVLPLKNNNRIIKQDGAFILCGLSKDYRHLDLNELRYKAPSGKWQIFIVEGKRRILAALNAFCINKASLFPEIDDVADYIKGQY